VENTDTHTPPFKLPFRSSISASRNGPGLNDPPGLNTATSISASGHVSRTDLNAEMIDSAEDASASMALAVLPEGRVDMVASRVERLRERRARECVGAKARLVEKGGGVRCCTPDDKADRGDLTLYLLLCRDWMDRTEFITQAKI
jgi:hypothetical protein